MRPNRIACREAVQAADEEFYEFIDELESWYGDDEDVFDHWEERVSFVPPADNEWRLIRNDQLQAPHRCVTCGDGFEVLTETGACISCGTEWRPESDAMYMEDLGLSEWDDNHDWDQLMRAGGIEGFDSPKPWE